MPADPHIIIWEFSVPSEHTAAFIAAYGPSGDWARLFRKAPGYRGSELYRDRTVLDRFVTVDFWLSPGAHHEFLKTFGDDYAALDRACERLTTREQALGTFALADLSQAGF